MRNCLLQILATPLSRRHFNEEQLIFKCFVKVWFSYRIIYKEVL